MPLPFAFPLQVALAVFILLAVVLAICAWCARRAAARQEFRHDADACHELAQILAGLAAAVLLLAIAAAWLLWGGEPRLAPFPFIRS